MARLEIIDHYQLEGLFERSDSHIRLAAEVTTDRMLMAADVARGDAVSALRRYHASPVDVQRRPSGRRNASSTDGYVSDRFEEMAADGLAGLLEAATARLAELEVDSTSDEVEELAQLLHLHCEDALDAEPLLGRVDSLCSKRSSQPAVSKSDAPIDDVTVALTSPVVFAEAPHIRRSSWHWPIAAAFALLVSVMMMWTLAMRRPAPAPKESGVELARLAVLDASGSVRALSVRRMAGADLSISGESDLNTGSKLWPRQVREASALNGLAIDPADADPIISTSGERGVDLARLHDDGSVTPLVQAPEDDYGPVFSTDGHWLAYSSARGSTAASYDVDVWLRDRWADTERPIAARPRSYEQPLRFDLDERLWVSAYHTAENTSELCLVVLATNQWDCRRVPTTVEHIIRVRGDTIIGIVADSSLNASVHIAEMRWERDRITTRELRALSVRSCTVHPVLELAACVTADGAVGLIDSREDVTQWHVTNEHGTRAQRVFFLTVRGERSRRLNPSDVVAFGSIPPTLTVSPAMGTVVTLAGIRRWQSGILVRQGFAADQPMVVTGAVVLPLTANRWQNATVWISQLPEDERRRPEAVLSDSTSVTGVDGFTRNGIWDTPICQLDLPPATEPERRGTVRLHGRGASTEISVPRVGSPAPVAFALEFDGRGQCTVQIDGRRVSVSTRALPTRPVFVAVIGRAVGTTGVIRGLTVRGLPALTDGALGTASAPH